MRWLEKAIVAIFIPGAVLGVLMEGRWIVQRLRHPLDDLILLGIVGALVLVIVLIARILPDESDSGVDL